MCLYRVGFKADLGTDIATDSGNGDSILPDLT